jgi:hypothetical protein
VSDVAKRFRAFLERLPEAERRALGRAYAQSARERGVFVVKPDGSEVAIPPLITPAAIEARTMAQVSADAHAVLSALVRLTEVLMTDPAQAPLRKRLFGSFTPLEAEGLQRTWRDAAHLATARVDFLVDTSGRPRALEVNTTIPAMQGYSDCIAEAFLRELARVRGFTTAQADALVAQNGRNTDDLLASLIAHLQRLGGARTEGLVIAIVARRGDAQRGELEHYVRRWGELGHDAYLAAPDDVHREEGRARVQGRTPDLIYRHIFARRLEPTSEFGQMLLEPGRYHILNPISSHLEVKGMLGLASAAADPVEPDDRWRLSDDERAAIRRTVPWTRLLQPGPTRAPDGSAVDDLVAWTRAHGAALVLKRSWDYGGKSVFLGTELDTESSQSRLRALTGRPGELSWAELVDFALGDTDAWVVQALVPGERETHLRVEPDGSVAERRLYVDLSAYTNTGPAPRPTGGAVRASESRIVNILGGGGLAPLVRADVIDALLK